jgi:hypothetical protein
MDAGCRVPTKWVAHPPTRPASRRETATDAPWYMVGMSYRRIEIRWMPKGPAAWGTFAAARKEAARLWADLVERHHRIRRLNWH